MSNVNDKVDANGDNLKAKLVVIHETFIGSIVCDVVTVGTIGCLAYLDANVLASDVWYVDVALALMIAGFLFSVFCGQVGSKKVVYSKSAAKMVKEMKNGEYVLMPKELTDSMRLDAWTAQLCDVKGKRMHKGEIIQLALKRVKDPEQKKRDSIAWKAMVDNVFV